MSVSILLLRRIFLATASLTVVAGLALLMMKLATPAVDVPTVHTAAMEPQVAALIARSIERVKKQPDSAESWGKLGQVYHAHKLYAPAFDSYQSAIDRAPESFRWHYLAAHAKSKIKLADAVPLFENAREISPERDEVNIALADALVALGRNEDARKYYAGVLARNDRSVFANIGLARLALLKNELDAAVAYLETAREISPQNGEIHTLLAQLYARQGNNIEAQASQKLSQIHGTTFRPSDPTVQAMENLAINSVALTQRGVSLTEQGNFKAAETQFRNSLAVKPTAGAHANLASALLRQGKIKEALAEFDKARKLDTDNAETLSNHGLALLQAGQSASAEKTLLAALEADPANASAHFNYGLLRETEGRFEFARKAYKKALELDPALADAYLNLGALHAREDDLDAAIEAWESFRLIKPNDPAAIFNIGQAQKMAGRHEQAIKSFQAGLRVAPNSSRFVFALAWELATAPEADLRDGRQAVELVQRLVAAQPRDPAVLDLQAAALAETGDFDRAINVAESALLAASNNLALAGDIRQRLTLYRDGEAFRQADPTTPPPPKD